MTHKIVMDSAIHSQPKMKTHFVVTGIVLHNNKVLILKKSSDDYNYPNKWGFCSGFIKEFEAGEDAVLREIKEETGLDANLVKTAEIFEVKDEEKQKTWVVKCFLCSVQHDDVKLCHENQEYKWILPEDMDKYETVPAAKKDLKVLSLIQ